MSEDSTEIRICRFESMIYDMISAELCNFCFEMILWFADLLLMLKLALSIPYDVQFHSVFPVTFLFISGAWCSGISDGNQYLQIDFGIGHALQSLDTYFAKKMNQSSHYIF